MNSSLTKPENGAGGPPRFTNGRKVFIVALGGGLIIALILISLFLEVCRGRQGADSRVTRSQGDALGFSAIQNDSTGYGGSAWGTPVASFLDVKLPDATEVKHDVNVIPECPTGSKAEQSGDRSYFSHQCKVQPEAAEGTVDCIKWGGNTWDEHTWVPCGTPDSFAITYTGALKCPISRQVQVVDRSTGKLSDSISCLPDGWVEVAEAAAPCPAGDLNTSPALLHASNTLFVQEYACYGPPPPPPEPDTNASFISADSSNLDDNHAIAKLFNLPDSQHGGGMLTYMDTDFTVVPKAFQFISKDGSEYIFYKRRLAMVYSSLDAHHRDEIYADLRAKYQEVGSSTFGWTQHTLDDGPQDSTSVNAILFKRGNTNTRIYLIAITNVEGVGVNVSSLRLLYIPTAFMWEIQHDIAQIADRHQAVAREGEQKTARPDIDKLQ